MSTVNDSEATAGYGIRSTEPIQKIFTGHTLDLRDVLAISDVLAEYKSVEGYNGALTSRKLYIEIVMRGSTIRYETLRQELLGSRPDEKQIAEWKKFTGELVTDVERLIEQWKVVKLS